MVMSLCERLGLPHTRIEVDVRDKAVRDHHCIEEAARIERYRVLDLLRRELGAEWVAVGHTRSDQAETVLMRLERGVGLDGLGCMRFRQHRVIRPLLTISKVRLEEFLSKADIRWCEDPSNRDRSFERVAVRQDLMPLSDERLLASLADEARIVRSRFDRLERAYIERYGLAGEMDYLLNIEGIEPLEKGIAARVLRRAARNTCGLPLPLWRKACLELLDLARGHRGRHLDAHRLRAHRVGARRGGLVLEGSRNPPKSSSLNVSGAVSYRIEGLKSEVIIGDDGPATPLWGRVPLDARFTVRARRPGDRLLGSDRKLKKSWERLGMWSHVRDLVPLVASEDKVMWTALEPDRTSNGAYVSFWLDVDHPLRLWLRTKRLTELRF